MVYRLAKYAIRPLSPSHEYVVFTVLWMHAHVTHIVDRLGYLSQRSLRRT